MQGHVEEHVQLSPCEYDGRREKSGTRSLFDAFMQTCFPKRDHFGPYLNPGLLERHGLGPKQASTQCGAVASERNTWMVTTRG